jgi:hypothetical protein
MRRGALGKGPAFHFYLMVLRGLGRPTGHPTLTASCTVKSRADLPVQAAAVLLPAPAGSHR